jgi:hypothetical protein
LAKARYVKYLTAQKSVYLPLPNLKNYMLYSKSGILEPIFIPDSFSNALTKA